MYELVLLAIPVVIAVYFLKREKRPENLPPGPKETFLWGNFKDVDTNNIHHSLHELSKVYGPVFSLRLLSKRVIVFSSADVIRKAFQSDTYKVEFNDKPKGFYGTYMLYNHQDVLFGPYKEVTFKVKSIMYKGLEPFYSEDHIKEEVEEFIEAFRDTSERDCNPMDIVGKIIANLHTKILLGGVQTGDADLIWNFANTSNSLLHPSIEATLKLLPVLRLCGGKCREYYRTARESRERMLKRFFLDQKVSYSTDHKRGLVDMCLQIQKSEVDESGVPWLTDEVIQALVIDIIGGGVISTTNSFLGLLLNLVHNPDCQTKLKSEIDTVVGKERFPIASDVTKLPYCHAVILENFRYNSIVPIINHLNSTGDLEFEGFCIPKGSVLFGCLWSAHHDDKLWKDPWNFRPERFIDDQGKLLSVDHVLRKSLNPLGLGARSCVGKTLAHIRLVVYIAAVLQQFDILPPKSSELFPNNPNLFKIGPVLQLPEFQCRLIRRSDRDFL